MKYVFRYNAKDTLAQLATTLKRLSGDNPVYFCVGSDKALFDSLGPRVGTRLKERSNGSVIVYGIEGATINALNVKKAYRAVKYLHPESKIIVIDASTNDYKGTIRVKTHGICPGSGAGKDLGRVGDFGIMCCTTSFYRNGVMQDEYNFLLSRNPDDMFYREPTARLKRSQNFINAAADAIADAILLASA